jgi:O-antigen/teichoic acid export membrane protein
MKIIVGSALFTIACNVVLIPRFGMIGAAIASVSTELLFLLVVSYLSFSRVIETRILVDFLKIGASTLIASLAFLLPTMAIIKGCVFVFAYVSLYFVLKMWGQRELQLLRLMVKMSEKKPA